MPRSPTRRLVGVRVVPQRDADCKDDGCVILCDKQALFLAVEADAEGCQFSRCSSAGATNALVKSARQLSRRHESRWELPVTPRTRFIQIKREKCFAAEDFLLFFSRSKRQAAQRQSASLGYYVNIRGRTYGSEFKGHVVISNGLWMQTNAAGPF